MVGRQKWLVFLVFPFILYFMIDFFVRSILYPAPWHPVEKTPPAGIEESYVPYTKKHKVHLWLKRHNITNSPLILFFHGNGVNVSILHKVNFYQYMVDQGAHIVAVEYPGYGRSEGVPSEKTLTQAAFKSYEFISDEFKKSKIILMGRSLGAAVAFQLAKRLTENGHRYSGLILISPWVSLTSIANQYYSSWLVNTLLTDRYNSMETIKTIKVESLLIHGKDDNIIPFTHAERLKKAFQSPLRFVALDQTGHNDIFSNPETLKEINAYISKF